MNKTQKRICEAYEACLKLCNHRYAGQAYRFLEKALDAAREGESGHRRMGSRFLEKPASRMYKLPVADAARFFAVKWFLDETAGPEGYNAAASLRTDVLYALAARDEVREHVGHVEWRELRDAFKDVRELDYSEVFAA